jgi:hypothetical protein
MPARISLPNDAKDKAVHAGRTGTSHDWLNTDCHASSTAVDGADQGSCEQRHSTPATEHHRTAAATERCRD